MANSNVDGHTMNRHEYLKAYLQGAPLIPEHPANNWLQQHIPLRSPALFTPTGRRINHFCVGSDPEFAFRDPRTGDRLQAINAGLKVGLAAGCDQNERLVELRPWPSQSVVEHVAGILTALRWLFRVYGHSLRGLEWRAGAFYAGDGMGGHVHFGRKRPTRPQEVEALDGLARVLRRTGIFPVAEWNRRMQGDAIGQHYGQPGDFRIQTHGYEYRSLPSWLQSPVCAFAVLTCAKLAVVDPTITCKWIDQYPEEQARSLIKGLAKLYKGRDDDAYILYHLLTTREPEVFGINWAVNFAPAWGIPELAPKSIEDQQTILPSLIKPSKEAIQEIIDHLMFNVNLTFRREPKTFIGELPTADYIWLPSEILGGRRAGFGDLLHNLVRARQHKIQWEYANKGNLRFYGMAPAIWRQDERDFLRHYCPDVSLYPEHDAGMTTIQVPRDLCQTTKIGGFRAILAYSNLLPLWTVDTVRKDSYNAWLETHPQVTQKTWRTI